MTPISSPRTMPVILIIPVRSLLIQAVKPLVYGQTPKDTILKSSIITNFSLPTCALNLMFDSLQLLGVRCESICERGKYGSNCQNMCDCEHGSSCEPESGRCVCERGYTGPRCDRPCEKGFYGVHCKQACPPCTSGELLLESCHMIIALIHL